MESMDLNEVLDWAPPRSTAWTGPFFGTFEDGHAVQYFYEPFLEAFDPELRKDLGVWYTPPEIVKYMVARVDRVLREELDAARRAGRPERQRAGPVLRHGRVSGGGAQPDRGDAARKGGELYRAGSEASGDGACLRIRDLPAPFVVSHLQLGLMLQAGVRRCR